MELADATSLEFEMAVGNNLPMMVTTAAPIEQHEAEIGTRDVLAITSSDSVTLLSAADKSNQNLTGPQRKLLLLHQRLGHANMQRIQALCGVDKEIGELPGRRPMILRRHVTTKSCQRPLCAAC
jgi:hypothetical protein